jgi:hypothetical protein
MSRSSARFGSRAKKRREIQVQTNVGDPTAIVADPPADDPPKINADDGDPTAIVVDLTLPYASAKNDLSTAVSTCWSSGVDLIPDHLQFPDSLSFTSLPRRA